MADTALPTGTEAPVRQEDVVAGLFASLRTAETAPETPVAEAPADVETTDEAPASEDTASTASEDSDAEAKPTEADAPQKMKFLIDGEEVDEDTLVEYKKNGLRQADYTKKTQEISTTRKQIEQERAQEREQTLAHWQKLQAAADALVPKEPDWVSLQAQVREGKLPEADYQRFAAQWLADKQQRDLIAAKTRDAEAAVQADRQKAQEAQAKANADRVMELVPEFKDESTRRILWGKMTAYAKSIAPDIEEAALLGMHPAAFKMLKDATELHELKAKTNAPPKVKLVTPLKPTAVAATQPKVNPMKQALGKVIKSGKAEDGAELFRAYRELGGDKP